ncbi:hypothetical protein [Lysobacter capsici]|uniref:hypothetical protein n=1 Tax=Lysobacter capsici TaxID=435897 RepID=UPI00287B8198|nr:hypothetical protein [Lysobacter capsici]WND80934.1 hypothetical protein RJ610_00730 [Lysobacter capsici]WND86130.1 hypothetical protein RJ609_00730 [Lysobacter capsici]
MWRMPANAPRARALDSKKKRFSLVTFLLSLLTKESNSAACGRKLLILPLASKALELQSFEAFKALKL